MKSSYTLRRKIISPHYKHMMESAGKKTGITQTLFPRLLLSALLSAIVVFSSAASRVKPHGVQATPTGSFEFFQTGGIYEGWKFEKIETLSGNQTRLTFNAGSRNVIELFAMPKDSGSGYYATTRFRKISYRSQRPLSGEEEATLSRIIDLIQKNETLSSRRTNPAEQDVIPRIAGLFCIIFLVLTLLVFDLSFRFVPVSMEHLSPESLSGSGQPAGAATGRPRAVLSALLLLPAVAIAAVSIADFPWGLMELDDFSIFSGVVLPGASKLEYILGDTGLPSLPYRFMLVCLAPMRSVPLIQGVNLTFEYLTIILTYFLALRLTRPALAWTAPVTLLWMMLSRPSDLRGYFFFIFFTFASFLFFEAARRKPGPARLFSWTLCYTLALTANPLTATAMAGPALYYFFSLRKAISRIERRLFDVHFVFIVLVSLALVPFGLEAVTTHQTVFQPEEGFAFRNRWNDVIFLAFCFAAFSVAAIANRKNFRMAVFGSAAAGTAVTSLLIAAHILSFSIFYLLFIMPFTVLAIGILAELLWEKIKTAHLRFPAITVVASAIAFLLFLRVWRLGYYFLLILPFAVMLVGTLVERFGGGIQLSRPKTWIALIAALVCLASIPRWNQVASVVLVKNRLKAATAATEAYLASSGSARTPTAILDPTLFFYCSVRRFGLDGFEKNPLGGNPPLLTIQKRPDGGDLLRIGNYLSSHSRINRPCDFFSEPFLLVAPTRGIFRAPDDGLNDCRCKLEKTLDDVELRFLRCEGKR